MNRRDSTLTAVETRIDETASPAPSPSARAPERAARPRRWLSLLAAVATLLGIGLLAPAPASAAAQYATVTVCFTVPGGSIYPGGAHTGNVNHHVRSAPSWNTVHVASFAGSANGCSRWNVQAGVQFRFQAWSTTAGVITCGNTPWYSPVRAGYTYHLGYHNAYRSASKGRECL